jgi:hypothetical protein
VERGKTRITKNSYIDNLSEMQSALFILKCLSEGKNEEYLIQRFDNDEQFTELKLLMVNVVGEYVITNKGKDYLQKYNPHW